MGFGILDDTHLEHVPGTAVLLDEAAPRVAGDPKLLKHAKGAGEKDVVLGTFPPLLFLDLFVVAKCRELRAGDSSPAVQVCRGPPFAFF